LHLRKLKWNHTLLEVSNKMSKKTHSQDSNSDFEKIWKEMDEIEPLTPSSPSEKELTDEALRAYREAALSDSYMFGDYNGYEAYQDYGDIPD